MVEFDGAQADGARWRENEESVESKAASFSQYPPQRRLLNLSGGGVRA